MTDPDWILTLSEMEQEAYRRILSRKDVDGSLIADALVRARKESEQYEAGYRYESSGRAALEEIVRKIVNGEKPSTEEMVATLQHAIFMSSISPAQPIDVTFEYRDKEIARLIEENKRKDEVLRDVDAHLDGLSHLGIREWLGETAYKDAHAAIHMRIRAAMLQSKKGGE